MVSLPPLPEQCLRGCLHRGSETRDPSPQATSATTSTHFHTICSDLSPEQHWPIRKTTLRNIYQHMCLHFCMSMKQTGCPDAPLWVQESWPLSPSWPPVTQESGFERGLCRASGWWILTAGGTSYPSYPLTSSNKVTASPVRSLFEDTTGEIRWVVSVTLQCQFVWTLLTTSLVSAKMPRYLP